LFILLSETMLPSCQTTKPDLRCSITITIDFILLNFKNDLLRFWCRAKTTAMTW